MKTNVLKAWIALKAIGAPVLGPEMGWAGVFAISGEQYGHDGGFYPEHRDLAPDGNEWCNFYTEDHGEVYSTFGVHHFINETLENYGLYAEWINPGVLGVYNNV